MQSKTIVSEMNYFAMQSGIVLGIFGIVSLIVFRWSLVYPFFSTLFGVMLVSCPILTTFLTIRVRNYHVADTGEFSFMSAFLHTLLTGIYASIWVALFIFVYLQYFDHGTIFDDYAQAINTPEMQVYLQESGINEQLNIISGSQGIQGLIETMKRIGSVTYAVMPLYITIFFGPIISTIIAIICRKK